MSDAAAVPPDTFPYLFFAYTAIWVILVVYLVSLGRRLSTAENKLDRKGS